MSQTLTSSKLFQDCLSLLIYQSVWESSVGRAFINLLNSLATDDSAIVLQDYGEWFRAIANTNLSWHDYIVRQILLNHNPFSHQVQTTPLKQLPLSLIAAVKHDLEILEAIANLNPQQLSQWVQNVSNTTNIVVWQPEQPSHHFLAQSNWQKNIDLFAQQYQQHGVGIFAQYKAFRWQQDHLIGIEHPDPIQLDEIVGYESQKQTLVKNTEFLISGHAALNVLLYGSRGSGKSSLVKALLSTYAQSRLRLVEVDKFQLKHLPLILEQLRDQSQKFIIFVDDLSFEEDDEAFKALKVVLEGSATAKARNVIVYATSNRRHLVREFFNERPTPAQADEIQAWDTMQEKLSFGDRFGITLTFSPANQSKYLTIVKHLAQLAKINLPQAELEFRAKQWATQQNGRSGRSAKQFIDFISSEIATDLNT